MALALQSAALSFAGSAPLASVSRASAPVMETVSDLKVLAEKRNPKLGYW